MIRPGELRNRAERVTVAGRGRPRAPYLRVSTSVRIREDVFDELCRQAKEERRSLHATINDRLERSIHRD
jgi:hypothetical protein